MSEITPDHVAEILTSGDNDYDEVLEGCTGLSASGNVVHIKWTPANEVGQVDEESATRFEAHVFQVEPEPPVAAEPVVLSAEDARELSYCDVEEGFDGWTVVANERRDHTRWMSHHRLVIRNEAGEHFAASYRRSLTEQQECQPWEDREMARFNPVARRAKVVRVYEWGAVQTEQDGDR